MSATNETRMTRAARRETELALAAAALQRDNLLAEIARIQALLAEQALVIDRQKSARASISSLLTAIRVLHTAETAPTGDKRQRDATRKAARNAVRSATDAWIKTL